MKRADAFSCSWASLVISCVLPLLIVSSCAVATSQQQDYNYAREASPQTDAALAELYKCIARQCQQLVSVSDDVFRIADTASELCSSHERGVQKALILDNRHPKYIEGYMGGLQKQHHDFAVVVTTKLMQAKQKTALQDREGVSAR